MGSVFFRTFAAMFRSILYYGLLLLMGLTACSQQPDKSMEPGNSVYYWRTDLRIDSTERAFMRAYDIKKVYCRYFDVVQNDTATGPVPNATMTFSDSIPEGVEIIPTVYITEDCMHRWHKGLAEKLVRRIRQMNETNDIAGVREIQIDCDYTAKSRRTYYEFLDSVRSAWGGRVSTTIRLHQLSMSAPRVDYGVLMIYNTGDPNKFDERNPILDLRDVQPYLRYLSGYSLPLAAAYPVFLWQRNIYGVRVEHVVEADEILQVKAAVEKKRSALSHTILLYHLDHDNINRYNHETFESIYRH